MERQTLTNKQYIFGLIYCFFQSLPLPLIVVYGMFLLQGTADEVKANFIYFAINFTVTTCLFSRILAHDCKQLVQQPGRFFKSFGIGFGIYYAASVTISVLVSILFPEFSNLNDASIGQMLQDQPLIMFVSVVFLAPVGEELLYRGVFYGFIRKKSKIAAYIVSSVVFSLIHIVGYISMADIPTLIISFVQYLPAGVAFAYSYEKSGSLLCPILMHMTANFMATMAMR
jgi:membrane protease YdiL (CAAX protease family)